MLGAVATTVEPPLMTTSLDWPVFFSGGGGGTVHIFCLASTSLQWPLSSVPWVAIVESMILSYFRRNPKRTPLLFNSLTNNFIYYVCLCFSREFSSCLRNYKEEKYLPSGKFVIRLQGAGTVEDMLKL